MPEMNGYELTRQLRATGFNKPIIGITAATVGDEADELNQAGADAVIAKPIELTKLLKVLNQIGRSDS